MIALKNWWTVNVRKTSFFFIIYESLLMSAVWIDNACFLRIIFFKTENINLYVMIDKI